MTASAPSASTSSAPTSSASTSRVNLTCFPVLKPASVLQKRWKVLRKLAEGGFGAVYEAFDRKTKLKAAVKLESCEQANPVLKLEAMVLLKLRGKTRHACGIVGIGVDIQRQFNYIVMDLMGKSLLRLRRSMPERKFSETTVIRLAKQCLTGVKDLHDAGFVHRDIKPENFAIGQKTHRRIVYLIDFGLARYYRTIDKNGKVILRPPRETCRFQGTVRYASPNAHNGKEVGRHDDIWSLLYVLVECQCGKLPWNSTQSDSEVVRIKADTDVGNLLADMADEFKDIYDRLEKMRYATEPNYKWFRSQFRTIQQRKKLDRKGPFEWEVEKSGKRDDKALEKRKVK